MHTQPIYCFRPTPEKAAEFAAPPYDVFNRAQAAEYVRKHPQSFLTIDRPETAFAPDKDMYAPEVYSKARELLNDRVADGTLLRDESACYYIWRMSAAGHTQTGLVCAAAVADYESGVIRRHELTRKDKEQDRINHIRATNAQTGPIFLTYRDTSALDALIALMIQAEPLYDFSEENGCHHQIWRIAREIAVQSLQLVLDQIPAAYIADGHHRAASAVAVCKERQIQSQHHEQNLRNTCQQDSLQPEPPSEADTFLAVLFPASQLQILPYNRVIADMGGKSAEQILDELREQGFLVRPRLGVVDPDRKKTFGLKIEGTWYELTASSSLTGSDVVSQLDTALVQNHILAPIFNITDPTSDPRISFVGGKDAARLAGEAAGESGVALCLRATSLDELMAVSDAGQLMPPKSTWFEPKLLSGLFIRHI